MQAVKQVSDQLSTIVLVVPRKHGLELTDAFLEVIWREGIICSQP